MKAAQVRRSLSHWTIERARRSGVVLAAILAVMGTACAGDSATGPTDSGNPTTPVGAYAVASVNGKTVPASVYVEGTVSLDIVSGKLTLTSDGKYSSIITHRMTVPGNISTYVDSVGGTWTMSGTTVQLTSTDDGSSVSATWANRALTIATDDDGVPVTLVYSLSKP